MECERRVRTVVVRQRSVVQLVEFSSRCKLLSFDCNQTLWARDGESSRDKERAGNPAAPVPGRESYCREAVVRKGALSLSLDQVEKLEQQVESTLFFLFIF